MRQESPNCHTRQAREVKHYANVLHTHMISSEHNFQEVDVHARPVLQPALLKPQEDMFKPFLSELSIDVKGLVSYKEKVGRSSLGASKLTVPHLDKFLLHDFLRQLHLVSMKDAWLGCFARIDHDIIIRRKTDVMAVGPSGAVAHSPWLLPLKDSGDSAVIVWQVDLEKPLGSAWHVVITDVHQGYHPQCVSMTSLTD